MSVAEIIARMQNKLAALDANAPRPCRGRIQLVLADQQWIMDLDRLTLVEGQTAAPDATLEMDNDTFVAIGDHRLSIADAQAAGRVLVSGDATLVAALQSGCCA